MALRVVISVRGRRTKGGRGKLNASAKRDRWDLVRDLNDRASRSHSTFPLPHLCKPATQAKL